MSVMSDDVCRPPRKAFARLPKDVVPSSYALCLQPDLTAFSFTGREDITVQVVNTTRSLQLNALYIKITKVSYKGSNEHSQEFGDEIEVAYYAEDEIVTFTFPEELCVGTGTLSISFEGELNANMKGFYRSKYFTQGGEERYGASTHFEPTFARFSFPCWDEPAVKATFDITLVVPTDRVALSNMPVLSEASLETDSSLKVVKFSRTPVMSTYLVAFVIGEYDYVEEKDSNGLIIRIYTPVGKTVLGEFALQVAVKTVPFYNKYFGIAYDLPKMDLIAVPEFAGGAMENWGLILYRETVLLIDPVNSSAAARQYVARVVGHEIAHMWFGNLVTMDWWTDLWLKEGLASWIEFLCVDHCFPDYDIWTQFATSDYTYALDLDALQNSHPIEVEVGHPSEVDEIFDAISYNKGSSVIRMIHDYIGDQLYWAWLGVGHDATIVIKFTRLVGSRTDTEIYQLLIDFRKGMNLYLTRHQYKNTSTDDLWAALGEASGKRIHDVMTTWTKQLGFPVLKVRNIAKGDSQSIEVTQEKFTADGSHDKSEMKWMVPVTVSTSSSLDKAVHRSLLEEKSTTIVLDDITDGGWIKVNAGGVGFYRTLYSEEMLAALLPGIKDQRLPPRDRLGLQNDLFALARAGIASCVDVLKVVEAFSSETNFTVWSDLDSNLSKLAIILQNTDYYDTFLVFARKLFSPVMATVGWDAKPNEGHLTVMLRSLVIGRLGMAGDQTVLEEARKRFSKHCDGSAVLPADLRRVVYAMVLRHGGAEDYEQIIKLFRSADLQEEKVRLLHSLGATTQPSLIQRTLDFALSDEVRAQDAVTVICGVTGSVKGRELAFKFVQNHWTDLYARYSSYLLARLVKTTMENFVTEEKALEIQEFFKKNPAPASERTIQQSLENIRLNARQLKRDGDTIRTYLATFQ